MTSWVGGGHRLALLFADAVCATGTLRSTDPNFIRCIIPNLQKAQKTIKAELVLEQLACNGVLEGIRISRKGFPNRVTYPEFVKRYYLLHPTIRRNEAETKDATQTIMKHNSDAIEAHFPTQTKDGEEARERPLYQFGVTKIFFRHGVLAWLEEQREKKLGQMVVSIQAGARGYGAVAVCFVACLFVLALTGTALQLDRALGVPQDRPADGGRAHAAEEPEGVHCLQGVGMVEGLRGRQGQRPARARRL